MSAGAVAGRVGVVFACFWVGQRTGSDLSTPFGIEREPVVIHSLSHHIERPEGRWADGHWTALGQYPQWFAENNRFRVDA
jgi:hypothetical protein